MAVRLINCIMWLGTMSRKSTGGVEVAPTQLDTDGLGIRNRNMIDIAPVPDRFKDPVAETKHHDVLHGFFAQIMVDPINLFFR